MSNKKYAVGYGKPPKHAQFKPGKSGNPKGRAKGAKNLKTELSEELSETILIKEGGKPKKVSKQRGMVKTILAKALQGDVRAASTLMNFLLKIIDPAGPTIAEQRTISADDQAIIHAFLARNERLTGK